MFRLDLTWLHLTSAYLKTVEKTYGKMVTIMSTMKARMTRVGRQLRTSCQLQQGNQFSKLQVALNFFFFTLTWSYGPPLGGRGAIFVDYHPRNLTTSLHPCLCPLNPLRPPWWCKNLFSSLKSEVHIIKKDRAPNKGSRHERNVQFFWTLFKKPLTPPPSFWTSCCKFFLMDFLKSA